MNMRKVINVLLVTVLLCMTVFALAEGEDSVVGEWYLTSIDDTAVTDTGAGIIIGSEGDAVLSYDGNVKEVSWRIEDSSIVFYENEEDLMYVNIGEDGTLWIESEGSKLVFSKIENTEEYDTVEAAVEVEAADFIGTWNPKSIIAYGAEYEAGEFEFTTQIQIADGEATVVADGEELLFTTVYDSGTLYIGDDDPLECRLREDGCMIFELEEDNVVMTIVMERAE